MTVTPFEVGDPVTADALNEQFDPPTGRLVQTVAQTGIADNTTTAVTFTTEDLDTEGFHSTSSNTSRVTPTVAGWYRVYGSVAFGGQDDWQFLEVFLRKNGSTGIPPAFRITPYSGANPLNTTQVVGCTALIECNGSTDYFEVCFRGQDVGAGSNIGTVVSAQFASVLEWEFVRPS